MFIKFNGTRYKFGVSKLRKLKEKWLACWLLDLNQWGMVTQVFDEFANFRSELLNNLLILWIYSWFYWISLNLLILWTHRLSSSNLLLIL